MAVISEKRAGVFLEDIAEQLGTVPASDYLIMRLPIALSEGTSSWTVNAEAGRKGNARPFLDFSVEEKTHSAEFTLSCAEGLRACSLTFTFYINDITRTKAKNRENLY